MNLLGYTVTTRLLGIVVGAIVLIFAAGLLLRSCQSGKTAKKQAEVSQGQADAAIGAGVEATNTLSNVAIRDAETDVIVAQGHAEIAAASQGTKGAAAKRAACRLKAYRDSPQCKEPSR